MKSGREKILEIIFLYAAAMSVRHRNCVERALSCLICYVERHARGVGAAWEVCESGLGEDSEVHRGVGGALTPLSLRGSCEGAGSSLHASISAWVLHGRGVGSGKLRESAGGVELRSSSMGAAAGSVGMPSLAVLHERTWEPLSGVSAL